MRSYRYLAAVFFALAACSSTSDEAPSNEFATEDELGRAAEDDSWKAFLGVWESTERVAAVGSVSPEHMIRSLEFKPERDDTSRYARRRMIEIVRPDCASCTDKTYDEGTYRSVADASRPRRGKIYTTTGGNTSSRDYYEISEDGASLTLEGTMGDGSKVTRVLQKKR